MADSFNLTEDNAGSWEEIAEDAIGNLHVVTPGEKDLLLKDQEVLKLPQEEVLPKAITQTKVKGTHKDTPRPQPLVTPGSAPELATGSKPPAASPGPTTKPSTPKTGKALGAREKGTPGAGRWTPTMFRKIEEHKERDRIRKEHLQTQIGVTTSPYYTIPENMAEILAGKGTSGVECRTAMVKMWVDDKWEHLENPPDELTVDHFMAAMSGRTPNSESRAILAVAQSNLKMAKLKAGTGTLNAEQVLAEGPTHTDTMMTNVVTELRKTCEKLEGIATDMEAAQAQAFENFVKSEMKLLSYAHNITALTSDYAQSFGHKADQLSSAMVDLANKKDSETGALMSASADVSATQSRRSMSVVSASSVGLPPPADMPQPQPDAFC